MDVSVKYEIVEKIIKSDNDELLNEIKYLLDNNEGDFWDTLPTDIKDSIKKAKVELDRGEGIPHDEVMDEVEKRFPSKE